MVYLDQILHTLQSVDLDYVQCDVLPNYKRVIDAYKNTIRCANASYMWEWIDCFPLIMINCIG